MKAKKWFLIPLVLFAIVYFGVLELSKNTLLGWGLSAVLFIGFIAIRLTKMKEAKLLPRLCSWIVLIAGAVLICAVSAPPYKTLPAVDIKNPEVTDVVTVEQGDITGVFNEDKSVEVFTGIPYAKPPVGDLRWKEPQEPDSWDGVRVCDHFAPASMQSGYPVIVNSLIDIFGYHQYKITPKDNFREAVSEDSLYLNVWKPSGDISDAPVMVFIHGGSLTTGQSSSTQFRGEDFAKQGIVYVTITYRLNVFGYMADESLAAESENGTTGNYGLLDQIQALKWVNQNIEAFGGDPSKITIAGESAGASSVNALCVSPLAKGLFRYAIAESSGITPKVPYHTFRTYDEALQNGKITLDEYGASSADELRSIPAEELVKTSANNSAMTVDGYAITEQPCLTYQKGNNNEEALLNGFNSHEANVFNLFTEVTSENYNDELKKIAGDYADEIEAVYPYDAFPLDYDFFLAEAGGDAKGTMDFVLGGTWFAYSHYTWSNYVADEGRPVYQYCFTKDNSGLRANHAGELPYAYGNLWRANIKYDESDYALSDSMQKYWINFAKTGDPNGEGLVIWEPYENDRSKVLEFGDEIKMSENMYNDLYPILDKYQSDISEQ